MKKKTFVLPVLLLLLCLCSCNSQKNYDYAITKNYKPDDPELYKTIVNRDSVFFSLYNSCDRNLKEYGDFYSEDIEFYHDKGGLMTSKKDIIEGTQKNVCGKVTRELVKGSIEVYPIKDFGALEIGLHKFHNNTEPENKESRAGRFMIFWKKENNDWKITKVVSLH
jgi:hypothetical protein